MMWTSWIRLPNHLWQNVATALTKDEAWRLLRRSLDQLGAKMIEMFGGPSGIDPRGRCRLTTQGRLFP